MLLFFGPENKQKRNETKRNETKQSKTKNKKTKNKNKNKKLTPEKAATLPTTSMGRPREIHEKAMRKMLPLKKS